VMTAEDVGNRAAVGDYVSRKSPIAPQMFVEQRGVCAGGLAIERVIGAHHRLRFTLDDGCAKRRKIGVLHIVRGGLHIDAVSRGLRAAMDGEVLGSSDGLQVFGIVRLQSGDERDAHARRQIWIFAVSLLAASPPRVAKDIAVRPPYGQATR